MISMLSPDVRAAMGGLVDYYRKRPVSTEARAAVLKLFCDTNGHFTDRMERALRLTRPARAAVTRTGLLGTFTPADQQRMAASIRQNGFYVFENRLPADVCDEIARFARTTPAIVYGHSRDRMDRYLYDEKAAPLGKKYAMPEDEIARNPGMQQLMGDQGITAVAEAYLGTLPSLSDLTLWWSTVHSGSADEDAGQLYHFDFDTPPRWLMIFVYLTDVNSENGPHMYVRGSHRAGLPVAEALRARGYVRIPDEDILAAYGSDSVVELQGKRGTVFAVDTIGFHKGKPLISGHRLMGQLVYSFAHFSGERRCRIPLRGSVHPTLAKAMGETPRVYRKFT